jgi:hypothetical protein
MRFTSVALASLAFAAASEAQNCVWVASGCPCLLATRPACENTVPLGALGAGNPNFQFRASLYTWCVPAGLPLFLAVGFAGPAWTLPAGLADPTLGLPCRAGMPMAALVANAGVTHAIGPAVPLPIPPGLAGSGHVLTAQMVVLLPGGLGLSDSSGVIF